ncbi:MAG: ABC transporter ATP-binding protein [bacterium]|nr:ABC transporter ATP-binding protein [bacterium]
MATVNQNENRLLYHVKPFIFRFIAALFFMAMLAFFTVLVPVVIEPLIDQIANISPEKQEIRSFFSEHFGIHHIPFLLLIIFLGQAVFNFLSLYFMKTLGLKVVRDIRAKLYRNLVYQSVDFLSKAKTGDLTSRISNDIEKIRFAVSENLAVYIRETFTLVGFIIYIFLSDASMALIAVVILPVASLPLVYFARRMKKRGSQAQETVAELSNFLAETVGGNKIVKAYNMEEYEIDKFEKMNRKHYRIDSRIAMIYSLSAPVMTLIGGAVAFAVFSVGINRIQQAGMSPGQFSGFFLALLMIYTPIKKLSQANNEFQLGKASFERVMQIIGTENPIKDHPSAGKLEDVNGEVVFKDVSFAYNEKQPVISSVNFTAEPNRMIALVGASGSGKSTLMNLLMRFYEPNSGHILVDGKDIASVTLESLRDSISLVTQDVFIFNDTIENNIAYGSKFYSFEDVERAAKIARADGFIRELPDGYQTVTGERGGFLSTGQRQRISIARAVLKKPAILIFDEATSSLDSESENLIQEAMVDVMKGRTTFVIAHRLSTIIEADRILVIERGEIKESGNHKELLVKRGLYYSLYNLQFPEMDIIM